MNVNEVKLTFGNRLQDFEGSLRVSRDDVCALGGNLAKKSIDEKIKEIGPRRTSVNKATSPSF